MSTRRSLLHSVFGSLALSSLVVGGLAVGSAYAQEARGSQAEAKAMADAALAHIAKAGFDAALKDFSADKASWVKKDLYVVVFSYEGKCLAHGVNEKLVGKSMWDIKDQNGKAFVQDFVASARAKAEGWVDLAWAHPQTKKPESKRMSTRRVPGKDAVLVVGYYL